jgi:hypothetical protein
LFLHGCEDYQISRSAILEMFRNAVSLRAGVSPPKLGGVAVPKAQTGRFQSNHLYECILETLRQGNHPVSGLIRQEKTPLRPPLR